MVSDTSERVYVFNTVSLLPQQQTQRSGLKYKVGGRRKRLLGERWKTT